MQSNRAAAHLIELLHLLQSLKLHETVQRFKHCRAGCVWSRYARLLDSSKHRIESYLARLVHNHTAQASSPQTLSTWQMQVRKQGRAPDASLPQLMYTVLHPACLECESNRGAHLKHPPS